MNKGLGRLEDFDERDLDFPVSSAIETVEGEVPEIPRRFWWADGWWGDQGSTPMCVAFSWQHYLEDGPVIQDTLTENRKKPFYTPKDFYDLCQEHDRWPGKNYDGTSVRAGAKILKHLGVINEYRWAQTIEDVIKTVKYIGPMVVGTKWYSGMQTPSNDGIVKVNGRQDGGHAYILNGIDENLNLLRIKNSWGRSWGKNGFAYISFDDFEKLLKNGGEACIAFENKMTEIPDLLME